MPTMKTMGTMRPARFLERYLRSGHRAERGWTPALPACPLGVASEALSLRDFVSPF